MKRLVMGFALASVLLVFGPSVAGAKQQPTSLSLDMYRAIVTQAEYADLSGKGYDIAAADVRGGGKVELQIVLDAAQLSALRKEGLDVKVLKNEYGVSARQFAALQAANGFIVWRDYDSPDGHRAQLYAIARDNPSITKLVVLGRTIQGRELIALKVTQDARKKDGRKPAVLYTSTQHAREWITPEVNSRLMKYFVNGWRNGDEEIRKLLRENEYWFVIVANPDGYQYTFASEDTRLWRKNLRDNNANGTTEVGDGVDPNRNYPEHFKYDEEGSSSVPSSDTYRGPLGGLRGGDAGDHAPLQPRGLRLPRQLALGGAVAPLSGGLADRHADRGRPDLLRAVRKPGQPGDRGLPSGALVRRPLRHERRDDRLRACAARSARVDARALRGL